MKKIALYILGFFITIVLYLIPLIYLIFVLLGLIIFIIENYFVMLFVIPIFWLFSSFYQGNESAVIIIIVISNIAFAMIMLSLLIKFIKIRLVIRMVGSIMHDIITAIATFIMFSFIFLATFKLVRAMQLFNSSNFTSNLISVEVSHSFDTVFRSMFGIRIFDYQFALWFLLTFISHLIIFIAFKTTCSTRGSFGQLNPLFSTSWLLTRFTTKINDILFIKIFAYIGNAIENLFHKIFVYLGGIIVALFIKIFVYAKSVIIRRTLKIVFIGSQGSGKTVFLAALIRNATHRKIGKLSKQKNQKEIEKIVSKILSIGTTDNIGDVKLDITHHHTRKNLHPKLKIQVSDVPWQYYSGSKENSSDSIKIADLVIIFVDFTTIRHINVNTTSLPPNLAEAITVPKKDVLLAYTNLLEKIQKWNENLKLLFLATKGHINKFSEVELRAEIHRLFGSTLLQTQPSDIGYFSIDSRATLDLNDSSMLMLLQRIYQLLGIKYK